MLSIDLLEVMAFGVLDPSLPLEVIVQFVEKTSLSSQESSLP